MAKKNTPAPVARPKTGSPEKPVPARPIPDSPIFAPDFWRKNGLAVLILIGLAFGLYRESISFGYVLDDSIVVDENRFTKQGFGAIDSIFTTESMTGYFGSQRDLVQGGRYRPLSIATFAVEAGIQKMKYPDRPVLEILSPATSHAINIFLYGLTGALLFGVLLALFPLKNGRKWWWSLPFVAALLFVLHPIHTEVVANIKGRDEILALLGSLASLWFALKYFDKNAWPWLVGMVVCFLGGVFSKENAITFAAVVPMTGWFFTRATNRQLINVGGLLVGSAVFFLMIRTNIVGYFLDSGKPVQDLMNNPFVGMKGGERGATILLTLGWYLKLLVLPHPLTHDYYPYHVPKVGWSDWRALVSLVLYLGMLGWALWNLRRRSLVAWCVLFFLGTLYIVSNIPFSIGAFMNERFVYLSSVAFSVLCGWFLVEKLPVLLKMEGNRLPIVGISLLAIVGSLYAVRTVTRIPDWKDALSLNGSSIKTSPNSARANCFYAVALYEHVFRPAANKSSMDSVIAVMEKQINRALEIYPTYGSALTMKAGIVAARHDNDHDTPRLLDDFLSMIRARPQSKYIADYIIYLHRRNPADTEKLAQFCYRAGYEICFKKYGNVKFAREWFATGRVVSPGDPRFDAAEAEMGRTPGR